MKSLKNRLWAYPLIIGGVLGLVSGAVCGLKNADAAMTSSNCKVLYDSVNVSTSSNYSAQDTIGEQATGFSSSTNYTLGAGYQFMNGSFISITSPSGATLPAIDGVNGGVSTSSVAWVVTTDSAAGYSLYLNANTSPALQSPGGGSFADYTPSGASPDFTFANGTASSSFGFSPKGTDIVPMYKDNGVSCNTGSGSTLNACWDGFTLATKLVARSTASNMPSGTQTTVNLQAQVGASKLQDSGTYTATITATAVAL